MEPEENLVQEIDFTEKKAGKKWRAEPETGAIKFIRDAASLAKQTGVRSVFIMTVDENDHVDWMMHLDNDHDMSLICLALEDGREDVKATLFGEYLDEY